MADLRLELAARALRDLPSATASDFFTSPVARRCRSTPRKRDDVGACSTRFGAGAFSSGKLRRGCSRTARHFASNLPGTWLTIVCHEPHYAASNARAASTSVSKVPRYSVFLFGILMCASHLPECDGKRLLPVEPMF